MLIKINPKQLAIVESSLSPHASVRVDTILIESPKLQSREFQTLIIVEGSTDELYSFLYKLSTEFDIELM